METLKHQQWKLAVKCQKMNKALDIDTPTSSELDTTMSCIK